jgi:hypothetical protein
MPADQIRTRTVGCKMTDGEYERLSAVVESEGMIQSLNVRQAIADCGGGTVERGTVR